MESLFREPPPWYVAGPAIGLIVVGLLAATNERLGVVGGYADVVERVARRSAALTWKAFFLFGIVAGGLFFAFLSGTWGSDGYGWLSRSFEGDASVALALLVAGVLIGLGAKTAGGCTSGHGISGTSFGSPASFVSAATFTATAVATAFVTAWLFGS